MVWNLKEYGLYPYKISVAFKETFSERFSFPQSMVSRQNPCAVWLSYRRWTNFSLGELQQSQRLLFLGRMLWIILNCKHLSLFSTVTLKGSSYIALVGKFFSTCSASILGGLSIFETRCSRAHLAVTLEGNRLFIWSTLLVCCGLRSDLFHALGIAARRPWYCKKFTHRPCFSLNSSLKRNPLSSFRRLHILNTPFCYQKEKNTDFPSTLM